MSINVNIKLKKIISHIIILIIIFECGYIENVRADNFAIYSYGDYNYTVDEDGNAIITKYNGTQASVVIPDSLDGHTVISIEAYAFANNKSLKEVTLPGKIEKLGMGAFENVGITSIVIPKSLKQTTQWAPFKGTAITDVYFEEGTEKVADYLMDSCYYLENIHWADSITEIGWASFAATAVEQLKIPDTVTLIGRYAFSGCSKLTEVKLSNHLKELQDEAFFNDKLTSIVIPKSLERAYKPFNGTTITDVYFEEGTEKVPEHLMDSCNYLENIHWADSITEIGWAAFAATAIKRLEIPDTVKRIDGYAFSGCGKLTEAKLPNDIEILGEGIFNECPKLVVECDYFTKNAIYCIDNELEIVPSDKRFTDSSDKVTDRNNSMYYANTSSMTANGSLPFTINYKLKDKWTRELRYKQIVAYVPKFTELDEESVKLDGKLISDYDYDENSRKLTIPITNDAGTISFSVVTKSKEKIVSYAYISAYKEDKSIIENIDVINEDFTGISLVLPDTTNKATVNISGVTTPATDVKLYINGVEHKILTSLKNGAYYGEINISNPRNNYIYRIEAIGVDEYGNEITVSHNITYKEKSPEVKSLILEYNEHDVTKSVDLTNNNGIKPTVYFLPESKFTFKVDFENKEKIKNVYVTSTRNGDTKSMEAIYDEKTDTFIADGYFDENNKSYVPGTIGIEYTEKNTEIKVSEDYDVTQWQEVLDDDIKNADIIYTTKNSDTVAGTIDLSSAISDVNDAVIDFSVGMIDLEAGTSFDDYLDIIGIGETVTKYIIPGNENYIIGLDLSDPENVLMILADTSSATSKVASLKLSMTSSLMSEYADVFDHAANLSYISSALGVAYNTYGIIKDYNSLVKDINNSTTIVNKKEALKKAEDLKYDQLAFMLAMTVLPIVASGGMAAPALVFSGLLAVMSASSSVFFDMRVAQIKSGKYKVKWAIDPSGYVYDAVTKAYIEDAEVTAYWIPYDETEDFWKNKPSNDEYGSIWDASEYEQMNPILTNADGKYAWDVPEGWWRVKCEKEGYETYWTDWMEVPPVQTDVNIALKLLEVVKAGDINGDGDINTSDAVLLKKHLAGYKDLDINEAACDINGDGNITSADAVILQKYLAGYKDVVLASANISN